MAGKKFLKGSWDRRGDEEEEEEGRNTTVCEMLEKKLLVCFSKSNLALSWAKRTFRHSSDQQLVEEALANSGKKEGVRRALLGRRSEGEPVEGGMEIKMHCGPFPPI